MEIPSYRAKHDVVAPKVARNSGPSLSRPGSPAVHDSILPSQIDALAQRIHLAPSTLSNFLTQGGRLSFTADAGGAATALTNGASVAGLPMSPDGAPDFAKIEAAGGKVTGAIPPAGDSEITYIMDGHTTTYYAAEVDLGDGSKPKYVKGLVANSDGSSSPADNYKYLQAVLGIFANLPNSMVDARARAHENITGIGPRIDTTL